MFPLWDDNSQERTVPFVTYAVILANLLVFALELSGTGPYAFSRHWGATPAWIVTGRGLATLFTCMFVHAGWMHVLGNMWFLWIFGDNVEDRLGHLRYLAFYLAAGLSAAAAHVLLLPASRVPLVGASGAIAGVMAAYVVLFPRNHVKVVFWYILPWNAPAWGMIGIWLLLQVAGVMAPDNGTAWGAHLGGFTFGFLVIVLFVKERRSPEPERASAATAG